MVKSPLMIFVYLQILDLVSTLTAIKLGGAEKNPLVLHFMALGPVAGLLLSKLVVTGIATGGALLRKYRGLQFANVAFAGIVLWNMTIVARLAKVA